MALHIYNSLSRTKEPFVPLHDRSVAMYVCGPTVYGLSHLGHAKSYVSFDVVLRYLRHLGYRVTYVQNITDVGHLTDDADMGEDKIAKQARADRLHPMQVVEMYTREYFADMDAMNVLRPDISPRATGHIPEQIEMVQELLAKGYAYEVNGSVYFDVSKDPEYGKLSGRAVDEAESGTRVDVKNEKRHPADFALWKRAEPNHIMQWNSPWGMGFPGWHIECSAMSIRYLGTTLDIHGGGGDLVYPHHESEIAQSEAWTGERPFARIWMHIGMLRMDGEKMSKSLGNMVFVHDLLNDHRPEAIRLYLSGVRYRDVLEWNPEALVEAGQLVAHLEAAATARLAHPGAGALDAEPFRRRFVAAMEDDLDTPQAISTLHDLADAILAASAAGGSVQAAQTDLRTLTSILGVNLPG